MSRRDPVTAAQRRSFLDGLGDGLSVKDAAAKAGKPRQTFYRLRASDEEFLAQWREAYEYGSDLLEHEAQRRAVEGVEDFRLDRDGVRHPYRRYSDTLLIFLLKARRPERFRDNFRVEHSGPDHGPIRLDHGKRRMTSLADVVALAAELDVPGYADVLNVLKKAGALPIPNERPK